MWIAPFPETWKRKGLVALIRWNPPLHPHRGKSYREACRLRVHQILQCLWGLVLPERVNPREFWSRRRGWIPTRKGFLSYGHGGSGTIFIVAFASVPVGVDAEMVSERFLHVLPRISPKTEQQYWTPRLIASKMNSAQGATWLWTAKESVYKVRGSTGWNLWSGKRIYLEGNSPWHWFWHIPSLGNGEGFSGMLASEKIFWSIAFQGIMND